MFEVDLVEVGVERREFEYEPLHTVVEMTQVLAGLQREHGVWGSQVEG